MGTKREAHILDAIKQNRIPERIVYYDSESETTVAITEDEIRRALEGQSRREKGEKVRKDHHLYLIQAEFTRTSGKRVLRPVRDYWGSDERLAQFWRDVDEYTPWGYNPTWVLAHNAKYDTLVTRAVPLLVNQGYRVVHFSDSNPFIMKLQKNGDVGEDGKRKTKNILLLSSTNFFAASLAKLGESFGLKKLDFDHDQKVDPSDPVFMDRAMTYGRRDVDILKTAMQSFISFVAREQLGSMQMTIAGQALTAYRARFMLDDIYIHANNRALELERAAYVGGRTEAFTIGQVFGDIYYVDINSMYPHVMRSKLYPKKLLTVWEHCTIEQVRNAIENDHLVIAECLIKTDEPLFHVKQSKLIFPTGTFWTTLSTPEIILALDEGLLLDVRAASLYEPADLFSSYVDHFYNERLAAKKRDDSVHDLMYKLFLNALYGKFGQKNIKWETLLDGLDPEIVGVENVYFAATGETKYIKTFGGSSFVKSEDEEDIESAHSFPAIAAHVTAYARMLLLHYIRLAGWQHVHYCDTDSLFLDEVGYRILAEAGAIDKDRLGALKLEKRSNDLDIRGCKDYRFDGKEKIKGIPGKNAYPLGKDRAGKMTYAVTKWGGFSDRLREGDMYHFYNTVIIKTLKREYEKGTVGENGRVTPFVLDAAEEQKRQAQLEMEITRKELAAALTIQETDPLKFWSLNIGYMRVPDPGDRYYQYYKRYASKTAKIKYFRANGALDFAQFSDISGIPIDTILELIKK